MKIEGFTAAVSVRMSEMKQKNFVRGLALLMFFAHASSLAMPKEPNHGKANATEISQAINAQNSTGSTIQSLSADITEITTDYTRIVNPHAIIGIPTEQQYQWAIKGTKFYVQTLDKQQALTTNYSDNKTTYLIISQPFRRKQARYGNVWKSSGPHGRLIWPANPLYFSGTWIADDLRHGKRVVLPSIVSSRFGHLDIISRQINSGAEHRYFVSPRYGHTVVRYEDNRSVAAASNALRQTLYEATDLKKFGSLWLATSGTVTGVMVTGGKATTLYKTQFQFSNVKLNAVPDKLFSPKLLPGTILNDPVAKKRYVVAANGTWTEVRSLYQKPVFSTLRPQISPVFWVFVLSFVAVILTGFLKWRRVASSQQHKPLSP